ncbi:hypothetical protein [Aridibaculum aurantiacum]|uniref:hypothetical protein n=1 Tax=Aridibaculum aurantiacum TaxID=2810307 RepID=UPI001A971E10|nr:hypothetical protein [Aridibaculum aurantiacum]
MIEQVEFLFDDQLVNALIKLVRGAKTKLLLIAPSIDLDGRIVDALYEKKALHNFQLLVLCTQNQETRQLNIEPKSLTVLKDFPDVELRVNSRLQAKFYLSDFEYIMTSLDLYNFSTTSNIEVGIRSEYASRGILGKALNVTGDLIGQGIDKVKQDVIGMEKNISPIEKFQQVFEASELRYKNRPLVVEKGGLNGLFGGKKLQGYDVLVNDLEPTVTAEPVIEPIPVAAEPSVQEIAAEPVRTENHLSAAQLSKAFGVQPNDINNLMQRRGLIHNGYITQLGSSKGLIQETAMGETSILFPKDLEELNEFRF